MSSEHVDVVIVGAGAAGLAAGRWLSMQGQQVRILEARSRIGGRIFTRHETVGDVRDLPVELGAEFVHGMPPLTWSLIEESGLATYELDGTSFRCEGDRLQPGGVLQPDGASQAAIAQAMQRMDAWLAGQAPESDASFDAFLRTTALTDSSARRAAAYVEGFNAADRRIISCRALQLQQRAENGIEGDRLFHLRSGYAELPAYMAGDLRRRGGTVSLGHIVRSITWRRGHVRIVGTMSDGEDFCVQAPRAIVTLPLGVLQAGSVRFDPVPRVVERAWQSLAMGNVERMSLVFERAFWNDRAPGMSFLFTPAEVFPTWWTSQPEPLPVITGWAGGTSAFARANVLSAGELASAALASLATVFGKPEATLRGMVRAVHRHDWSTDEHSRGAYSYVPVGALRAASTLSEPLLDTLYFAGEHTDVDNSWGTVHGALQSGVRAAAQCTAAAAINRS